LKQTKKWSATQEGKVFGGKRKKKHQSSKEAPVRVGKYQRFDQKDELEKKGRKNPRRKIKGRKEKIRKGGVQGARSTLLLNRRRRKGAYGLELGY